jgi:FkbM family methyltransferase
MNLCSLIEDGVTFVDIGANVGIYSSVVSRLGKIKRDVTVFAFEVDPDTYSRLDANASRHGFTAYRVGISSQTAEEIFVRGAVSHVTTRADLLNEYSIASETFSAQCRPLASFSLPGDKLVIKVDVEGAEMEVVEGARPLFEKGRVKAIYFDGVREQARVRVYLSDLGFEFFDGRTLEKAGVYTFSLLALRDGPRGIAAQVPKRRDLQQP